MTAGVGEFSNVILEYAYEAETIEAVINETTVWAEKKLTELQRKFDNIYPWRGLS